MLHSNWSLLFVIFTTSLLLLFYLCKAEQRQQERSNQEQTSNKPTFHNHPDRSDKSTQRSSSFTNSRQSDKPKTHFTVRHMPNTEHDAKHHDRDLADDSIVHVIITFKNAKKNWGLQKKFNLTVTSLLMKTRSLIQFYIMGDPDSTAIAERIISDSIKANKISARYDVVAYDAETLALDLNIVIKPMQKHFGRKKTAYYYDSLFYLSIGIHRILRDTRYVIMLDADLMFLSDIKKLHLLFREFTDKNIIGIAMENQPVYRHVFAAYRNENKGTRVGDPPPNGLAGFNSGVLLLNLEAMRRSKLYNSLLNEATLDQLTKRYQFHGHLGDQDFFTLLSMEYEELFYVLPCGWNRQLCTWWRDKGGYANVFDQYYDCAGPIHILHGNCNTPIPQE